LYGDASPTVSTILVSCETFGYGALKRRGVAVGESGVAWPLRKAGVDDPMAPLTGPLVVEPLTVPA
jgi:hypothetical protein